MSTDDARARAGWVHKQLEAELRRIGGQTLLDRARAEIRGHAGDRDVDPLTTRLEVLARHLDEAGSVERSAGDAGRGDAGRGDTGRGDAGRGDAGRGDTGRGDAGRGDAGRGDTAAAPGRSATGGGEAGGVPVAPGVDPTVPSVARVYDFALGGTTHYAADRRAGYQIAAILPEACDLARDCRAFVRRVVTWLVTRTDVDQIVDIGSGLPTAGNVHEVARGHRAGVRVLYVDNDPVVLAHGRLLLAGDPHTAVLDGDLRRPHEILDHPEFHRMIDTRRPYAVLASCVLHHLPDDADPPGLLDAVRKHLPAGSYLAVANFVAAPDEPRAAEIERGFLTSGLGSGRFRPPHEHHRYFDGLDVVAPGVVFANDWHPDPDTPRDSPVHRLHLAGLGRVL